MRFVASFVLAGVLAWGAASDSLHDALLRRFADEVRPLYVLFATNGDVYNEDTKQWRNGWRLCTTAVLWVDAESVAGVIAKHCFEETKDFRPKGSYIMRRPVSGRTGQKVPVSILGYRPSDSDSDSDSEVRLWKATNEWGYVPRRTGIAANWRTGDVIFMCGFWETVEYFDAVCDKGYVKSEKGDTYLSAFGRYSLGNIVYGIPSFWGYSGAPIFVYRDDEFQLLAIANGFSVFSALSFAWSVPPEALQFVGAALRESATSRTSVIYPAGAQSWAEEDRLHWAQVWYENALYVVSYRRSAFVLEVGGRFYEFTDSLAAAMAILSERLPLRGRMQDVAWQDFEMVPLAE